MNEWRHIPAKCDHCGKDLVAKFDYSHRWSFVLEGCRPVLYRHADGTTECLIRRKPRAYSDWDTNRQLEEGEQP